MAYSAGTFGAFSDPPRHWTLRRNHWQIVVTIIGLAEAHETSGGKAALAYFIPLIACLGCIVIGAIFFSAMIAAAISGAR